MIPCQILSVIKGKVADMKKDNQDNQQGNENKKKGFWKRLIDKLDRSMEEKAKQSSCCGKDAKGGKCC